MLFYHPNIQLFIYINYLLVHWRLLCPIIPQSLHFGGLHSLDCSSLPNSLLCSSSCCLTSATVRLPPSWIKCLALCFLFFLYWFSAWSWWFCCCNRKLPVGECWVNHFIQHHPELKSKYTQKYDYQCAKCEDSQLIKHWFIKVDEIIKKYGIMQKDIYNIDKTGF